MYHAVATRPARSTTLALIACVLLAGLLLASPAASAASLPPQLVAKLETDRARAQSALRRSRSQLAAAATSQRTAAAVSGRANATLGLLRSAAGLVQADLPPPIEQQLERSTRAATTKLDLVDRDLEQATEETAGAQAVALDADRRLRALQRASATEDERDTTLGSWRFGSGGPPVSAESLDRYLAGKGSPMTGEGAAFLESGVEHEVDPRLLVAIAGAESYFGITTCAPHNAWGWGCPTSPFRFDSWSHAIDTVTLGLREGYLDDGLESVGEIHLRYAPPDAANDPTDLNYGWADNVARFLVEQGGDPQHVAGVLGPSR